MGWFPKLPTSVFKIFVISLNLHEIGNRILGENTGASDMFVGIIIGELKQATAMRFEKNEHFEAYIESIDMDYDADDTTFSGYNYKITTPEFNQISRSEYGKGNIFKRDIFGNIGKNCYIPTSGYCFIECINCLTGKDYKEIFLYFIQDEKKTN